MECIKTPFSISLIEELKSKGFVSSAIMLPMLIGAYQIKDGRKDPINCSYLKATFKSILNDLCYSDRSLYLRKCESSNNFVLEPWCNTKRPYNFRIILNDKIVIYCNDIRQEAKDVIDIDDAVSYLIDKYVEVLGKYCNFIDYESFMKYPHMRELNYKNTNYQKQEMEIDIIKSLI